MFIAIATSGIDVSILRPAAAHWKRTICGGPTGTTDMPTKWASQVSASKPPLAEFPRPNLVRSANGIFDRDEGDPSTWLTLNGLWEWQPAPSATAPPPFGQTLSNAILVPFPIESCLSGVAPTSSDSYVDRSFYRLVVRPGSTDLGQRRVLLRFGAVNWQAEVYLNGALAANHSGGFDGFEVDTTDAWRAVSHAVTDKTLEILVAVVNPADRGAQPNGKARISAISSPGGDTYTPASGLWQSVWLEEVPPAFIARVQIGQNDATTLTTTAHLDPPHLTSAITFAVIDPTSAQVVASGSAAAGTAVKLTIPSPMLWSPASPFLYDLRVSCATCGGGDGSGDTVLTYFGLRTFEVAPAAAALPVGASAGYTHLTTLLVGPDLVTANLTLAQAETACDADERCVGFTYPSKDPSAPARPVPCTLKRAAVCAQHPLGHRPRVPPCLCWLLAS